MSFPVIWVFAHEFGDNGEDGKRIQRQNCVTQRELGRDVDVVGRSLRRFWDRNVGCGKGRERSVGYIKGESTSQANGNVNPERPGEIRMKPASRKESIGACIGDPMSLTHISGIGHDGKALQEQVCSPRGFLVCRWSSCPRSRNGGCRRDLLAVADRCSLMERLGHRHRSIARARPPERLCYP